MNTCLICGGWVMRGNGPCSECLEYRSFPRRERLQILRDNVAQYELRVVQDQKPEDLATLEECSRRLRATRRGAL